MKKTRHALLTGVGTPHNAAEIARVLEDHGLRESGWVLLDLARDGALRSGETSARAICGVIETVCRFQISPSWSTPRATALVCIDDRLGSDDDLIRLALTASKFGFQVVFLARRLEQIDALPNRVIDALGAEIDLEAWRREHRIPTECSMVIS